MQPPSTTMKSTIAGVTLILASLVCVVLFACLERPRLNVAPPPACTCTGQVKAGECGYSGRGDYGCGYGYALQSGYSTSSTYPFYQEYQPLIVLPDPHDESVIAINAALDCRDIRLNIDETTTFADLIRKIKDELKRLEMPDIHIELDHRALQEAGEIRSDTIVSAEGLRAYPPMRLRSALSSLLNQHDMTYMIRDESLLITTQEEVNREREKVWEIEQEAKADKWYSERDEAIRNRVERVESAPERAYEKSMQTYGLLVAGLALAWLAYFTTGLCFLVFAREKTSQKKEG